MRKIFFILGILMASKNVCASRLTEEEIFSEAKKYQGHAPLLPGEQSNRIWRESGEFRLEPGKVKIEFIADVDGRGLLYVVKQPEKPHTIFGCFMINK